MVKIRSSKRKAARAERQVARDVTYAHSAPSRGGRAVIRVLENATGRLRLIKRVQGYEKDIAAGRDFWDVMVDRYGLTLNILGGDLDNIPKEGPLIVVANHPYGILDGMVMGNILSALRGGDFRILAHQVFSQAEDLQRVILPISFDETREAMKLNLKTRQVALEYLKGGGAIGIFPGGTVATAPKPFGKPMDPMWRSFTAKMVAKSGATVVPIFFEGQNSRLFQMAGHVHLNLRTALMIKEFKKRVGKPVRMVIGKPVPRAELDAFGNDSKGLMDFLRTKTYGLSPKPIKSLHYGLETEERYKD